MSALLVLAPPFIKNKVLVVLLGTTILSYSITATNAKASIVEASDTVTSTSSSSVPFVEIGTCTEDGSFLRDRHNNLFWLDPESNEFVPQPEAGQPFTTLAEYIPASDACSIHTTPIDQVFRTRAITNADRFARDLPPLPLNIRGTGRIARDLKKRQGGPSTLPNPPVAIRGYVRINTASDGSLVGYIANTVNDYGDYNIATGDPANGALVAILPSATPYGITFNIQTENGPNAGFPYLAVSYAPDTGIAFIAACQLATIGGPNSACTATDGTGGQTQIWSLTPHTLELTLSVQPKHSGDGKLTAIGRDTTYDELDAYDPTQSSGFRLLSTVTLTYVPII